MKHSTILAAAFTLVAGLAQADALKLAVTTSFANSGLAEVLLPEIEADTGITVEMLVVGTGQAITLAKAGDVDAVLVHAKAAEEAAVAGGNLTHRREIMYNDFVIVGPAGDPAGVADDASAIEAMTDIEKTAAPFVSRGDDSGTHKAEQALWSKAGITPMGDWYRSVGQGMGAALNTAAAMDAYILSDRASWLNFENKGDLALLYAGDPAMVNQYSYLPVNIDLHPTVRADLAAQLEEWLTSDKAKGLIDGYRVAGEQVFTFNAQAM